jgi:SAM-dependent methyltransferase
MSRALRSAIGRAVPPRRYPGIPGRIHFNDTMLYERSPAGAARYRHEALNVVALIESALLAHRKSFGEVERWLDFGCGYGRIVRYLTERVDPGTVTAADVDAGGAAFCASEFGVNPVVSREELASVHLNGFDFAYSISVLTHLNERESVEFLRLIGEALAPGGIALFTTHGSRSLDVIERYGPGYRELEPELRRRFASEGIAFVPYPFSLGESYGMTWHSLGYVTARMRTLHGPSLELVSHEPHGLDGHQDVFVFRKSAA